MNYIDLGLSSGTLWADMNIGANSPEDRGLLMEFKEWGDSYEVPTKEQFEELINECTWEFINNDGKKGYSIIGKNGNKIFLHSAKMTNVGLYWSSTPHDYFDNLAYYLYFGSDSQSMYDIYRSNGLSVRPIKNNLKKHKYIHFYKDFISSGAYPFPREFYSIHNEAIKAIEKNEAFIETTALSVLDFSYLLDKGYNIYLHENGRAFQLKEGNVEATDKEISRHHNILKLWIGGAFNDFFYNIF